MNPKIEEKTKEFRELLIKQVTKKGWKINAATLESFLSQALSEIYEEGKKEAVEHYRPVLNDVYATQWLRNFGLDDNMTLNAGEVEGLLQQFIHDHTAKLIQHIRG